MSRVLSTPTIALSRAGLREALASGLEDIKEPLFCAAETLERQHEYLRFIHMMIKGGIAPDNV